MKKFACITHDSRVVTQPRKNAKYGQQSLIFSFIFIIFPFSLTYIVMLARIHATIISDYLIKCLP